MIQHFNFTLEDINNMVPYERDVYVLLIKNHIQEQKKREAELTRQ